MPFAPIAVLAALALKLVDFLKYLTNRRWNDAITQMCVWLAGIVVVVLFAASDFGASIDVAGTHLSDLNFAALLILGMSIGSIGSFAYDAKKAVDASDTAKTPPLTQLDHPKPPLT